MPFTNRRWMLGALACAATFLAHAEADPGLAEIIVTAEKVAEPLSRVSASIGVLTAAELQQQKVVDLQDVVNRVPGVASDFAGAPGTSTITIRGISPGGGALTTTGAYFDDVSISMLNNGFHGAYEPAFFDMDRIEVLRGPQGDSLWRRLLRRRDSVRVEAAGLGQNQRRRRNGFLYPKERRSGRGGAGGSELAVDRSSVGVALVRNLST